MHIRSERGERSADHAFRRGHGSSEGPSRRGESVKAYILFTREGEREEGGSRCERSKKKKKNDGSGGQVITSIILAANYTEINDSCGRGSP